MSDNLTTGASASSVPSGSVIATHDLSAEGGSGHAQKVASLPLRYTVTGTDVAVTVSTTVIKSGAGLTVPANTSHLMVSVEAGDVRIREDGTAPTATNGVLLTNGTLIEIPLPGTAANLQFIRSGSVDAIINVSYRRYI